MTWLHQCAVNSTFHPDNWEFDLSKAEKSFVFVCIYILICVQFVSHIKLHNMAPDISESDIYKAERSFAFVCIYICICVHSYLYLCAFVFVFVCYLYFVFSFTAWPQIIESLISPKLRNRPIFDQCPLRWLDSPASHRCWLFEWWSHWLTINYHHHTLHHCPVPASTIDTEEEENTNTNKCKYTQIS